MGSGLMTEPTSMPYWVSSREIIEISSRHCPHWSPTSSGSWCRRWGPSPRCPGRSPAIPGPTDCRGGSCRNGPMHWRAARRIGDVLVEVAHDLVSHIFDAGSAATQRSWRRTLSGPRLRTWNNRTFSFSVWLGRYLDCVEQVDGISDSAWGRSG